MVVSPGSGDFGRILQAVLPFLGRASVVSGNEETEGSSGRDKCQIARVERKAMDPLRSDPAKL